MSLPKLREKYDAMRLQAQRASPNNRAQERLDKSRQVIDDMRRLDEAEAEGTYQPPIMFALPPGRTA